MEQELEGCLYKRTRLTHEQDFIDIEYKKGSDKWKKETYRIATERSKNMARIDNLRKKLKDSGL